MNYQQALIRLFAAVALGGCAGGQSGTDSSDSSCWTPHAVLEAPNTPILLSKLSGIHTLEGTWANGAQASQLRIELQLGARLPVANENACGSLQYQVSAQLITSDGLVDASASLLEFGGSPRLTVPIPGLPAPYRNPVAAFAPSTASTPTQAPTLYVKFTLSDGELGIEAKLFNEQGETVGIWSSAFFTIPPRAVPAYVVPSLFVSACANAKPYTGALSEYTAFASEDDVSSSLVGTWVRCSGEGQPSSTGFQIPPAGLQIASDGAWQRLVLEDDRLIAHGGFDGEGTVWIDDISAMNNRPGFFQVGLMGPRIAMSGQLWGNQLQLELWDAETLDVYVRSDQVADTAANPYAARERGGAGACSTAEEGFLEPALGAELESVLAGDWTLCSGALPQDQTLARFDGAGSVAFFDGQGTALGSHSYTVVLPVTTPVLVPRAMDLILDDDTDFQIAISERPLKLWMYSETLARGPLTGVLSALP